MLPVSPGPGGQFGMSVVQQATGDDPGHASERVMAIASKRPGRSIMGNPLLCPRGLDLLVPIADRPDGKRIAHRAMKRVLDVVLSLIGMAVAAPLMAVFGVLIRLDSDGPVFFCQTRVGRDGRPFKLVKLRTMHESPGARATRVGCILRPMGLDELPQFWNVLMGDMSIVGPRPERPHLVAEYQARLPGYRARHAVRPGITGWAQVHGLRGRAGTIAERLRFDLEYVRTWNPTKDLLILARTVTAVWRDTRRELRL